MIDEIFKNYEKKAHKLYDDKGHPVYCISVYELKLLQQELQSRLYLPSIENELKELYKRYDAVVLERNMLKQKNKRLHSCVKKTRKIIQNYYNKENILVNGEELDIPEKEEYTYLVTPDGEKWRFKSKGKCE